MSGRFEVTPRANEDLEAIAEYTRRTWGSAQRDSYLADLGRRFQQLADHPYAGRPRDEVAKGYRSFPQGSHIAFYVVGDDVIHIIGLPHKSMDLGAYFDA